MSASDEIGKPLRADELKEKTVVIISKHQGIFLTVWVKHLLREKGRLVVVGLWAGKIGVTLLLAVQPDGSLVDDSGTVIHVFEYLGEIEDFDFAIKA